MDVKARVKLLNFQDGRTLETEIIEFNNPEHNLRGGSRVLSLSAQAKVLRVLQDNCIQKVGGGKDIKIDVRVIAATNKDLKKEIEDGKFREDLYHRLAVIIIDVPPLNSRKDDIPLLIEHFANNIADSQGNEVKKFSKKAIELMKKYDWSGNVRELRNVIERLIILGDKEISPKNVKDFIKI